MSYFYLFFALSGRPLRDLSAILSRRLTRYYWDRTKRHRLSVFGLGFIIFLVLVAIFGPFFTQDPTAVNFNEKNHAAGGLFHSAIGV